MDIAELLGWVETFFTELGIWTTIQTALSVAIIVSTAGFLIQFVRGR